MQRLWTSTSRFEWTPILTFTRRRMALLDWLEENTTPRAFNEGPLHVGVAYVANDLRLSVDRRGFVLQSGFTGVEVEALEPALSGVLRVLEPENISLMHTHFTFTCDLGEVDYDQSRQHLAERMSFAAGGPNEPQPVDTSALVDMWYPYGRIQVEWGVVAREEALQRFITPSMGRMDALRPEFGESDLEIEDIEDDVAEVGLLIDATDQPFGEVDAQGTAAIMARVADSRTRVEGIVERLYAGFGGTEGNR